MMFKVNKLFKMFKGQCLMFEKSIVKCQMLRNSKFHVHLSSAKAMFQYTTVTVGANDILDWLLSHRFSFGCWDFICAKRFDQPVFLAGLRILLHLHFQVFLSGSSTLKNCKHADFWNMSESAARLWLIVYKLQKNIRYTLTPQNIQYNIV